MPAIEEKFPFQRIQPYEATLITALLGGEPLKDPQPVKAFLSRHGTGSISFMLSTLIPVVGRKCAEASGVDPDAGRIAFTKAALLYAGVFTTLTGLPRLPCVVDVFQETVEDPPRIFSTEKGSFNDKLLALTTRQRIRTEREDFCCLLDRAQEALLVDSAEVMELALSGAGLMHTLASETLRRCPPVMAFEEEHPELSSLGDVFELAMRDTVVSPPNTLN